MTGGTPPGGRRHYTGARDRTPPTADRALLLPYRLRFGGRSRTWGGGMAFLDLSCAGECRARAYRMTAEQFADVHLQENAGDAVEVALTELRPGDRVRAGGGNYPTVLRADDLAGEPVYTFTCDELPSANAPTPAYMRAIATGLAESHGWSLDQVVGYLRGSSEVRDVYDAPTLSLILREATAAAIVAPPRHSSPS